MSNVRPFTRLATTEPNAASRSIAIGRGTLPFFAAPSLCSPAPSACLDLPSRVPTTPLAASSSRVAQALQCFLLLQRPQEPGKNEPRQVRVRLQRASCTGHTGEARCFARFSSTTGLTLRSSGLAPAGRYRPSFHSGPYAACLREPLNSNVRHHHNHACTSVDSQIQEIL